MYAGVETEVTTEELTEDQIEEERRRVRQGDQE